MGSNHFSFFCGCLQFLKHTIDLRERRISGEVSAKKELERQQAETELHNKLANSEKRVATLEGRIVTASAEMNYTIEMTAPKHHYNIEVNSFNADLIFRKNSEVVLHLCSQHHDQFSDGEGKVVGFATYDMNGPDEQNPGTFEDLKNATSLEIIIDGIQTGAKLKEAFLEFKVNGHKPPTFVFGNALFHGKEASIKIQEPLDL